MASTRSEYVWALPLGLILVLSINAVESDIAWNTESVRVLQGEQLQVTCSATDVSMIDALRIDMRREGKPDLKVAVNSELGLEFINSKRYSLNMESSGTNLSLILDISNARGEDSGELVCYTLTKPDRSVVLQLTVNVPVQSVYFEFQNESGEIQELDNGARYTMKEGYNTGVVCVALMDGTATPAGMTMTLGNEDVSDMFLMTSSPQVLKRKDELEIATNKATASYITMIPDRKFDDKELKCTASSPVGYQKEARLFLTVYYGPIITCKMVEYIAQLDKPVEVICHVLSNPEAKVTYFFEKDNTATEIKHHEHADQFRIQPQPVSENKLRLKIDIHRVHSTHYGKYFIRATNDYGQTETEFFIHQGAIDVDTEPTLPIPTEPKTKVPEPTEKQVLVKVPPTKQEKPKVQEVIEPEEPQASMDGTAPTMTVSMTTLIILEFVHISAGLFWR